MIDLPQLALSVRQPWAWAIIYAGKPLENRSTKAISHFSPLIGRRCIHASKGMTREEYNEAHDCMLDLGISCPAPSLLQRGGIIGTVDFAGIVSKSENPWFFGPRAIKLANPKPCDFIPSVGMLGLFRWKPADASIIPAPARWMLPKAAPVDLFA